MLGQFDFPTLLLIAVTVDRCAVVNCFARISYGRRIVEWVGDEFAIWERGSLS